MFPDALIFLDMLKLLYADSELANPELPPGPALNQTWSPLSSRI